jgi:hypothetical protein
MATELILLGGPTIAVIAMLPIGFGVVDRPC